MTPSEAAKAVAMLQAAYPAARWSEPTIELYELMLAPLEFSVARNAVVRIIHSSKFLPTVAEVLEAAVDVSVGPSRNPIDAWGDVGMAIRRIGSYGSPKFEDPLVAECVRIMGWRNLCLGDSSEMADRARFAELYADMQRKQRVNLVSEPGKLLPEARVHELPPRNLVDLTEWIGRSEQPAEALKSRDHGTTTEKTSARK
jgi:hypothetical protein